ncbi:MAG TPA: hypothetical protein PK954_08845, partial [Anaerolineales bacterium]|nr:hypothetical protein [Anaerolineales bacterium]
VRAIDADFQRQGPTALAILQTRATEQAPEIWLFNQARLVSQASAASPLDWPRAVETGAARVTNHRPLGPGLVLATVERSFLNPDGVDGATWRFTTLETYSQTADGGWIRAPMPDLPGRAVTRDHLEGAVRWTFSDVDQATVQEIAPLVARSLADLCALGLPCPEAGALEVRIVEPGATTATVLWGGFSAKTDASDLIAGAISSAGSLNRRHWLTIERLSFADTGMPAGPVEERVLARAITLQLIGRWLVSQYEEIGGLNGDPCGGRSRCIRRNAPA